jgi:putative ABC transport system permease protein
MIRSFLISFIRGFQRRKLPSSINIFGLAVSIAVCLTIFSYVQFEHSYDDFHEQADHLLQVTTTFESEIESNMVGYDLGPALYNELPEIKSFIRRHPNYGGATVTYAKGSNQPIHFFETNMQFVDSSFLDVFHLPCGSRKYCNGT